MVWGEFGDILEALEQNDEARKSLSKKGISINSDYAVWAFHPHVLIFEKQKRLWKK